MATQYAFGKIITDGLVLCLDAADRNSYVSGSTIWRDVAGSNNGTLTNGSTFNSANGGSIVFDGVDDYCTLGNVTSLNFNRLDPYTFSVFFKSTNVNPAAVLLGKMDSSLIQGYTLYHLNGRIYTDLGNFSGTVNTLAVFTPAILLSNNIIYNVVVTYDGSSSTSGLKIYLNSIIQSTSIQYNSLTTNFTNTAPFYIAGRYPSAYPFPGSIYTTQVYNRALSSSEVLQNYSAQKSRFGL
jgi:hypothetical protein